MGPKSVRDSNSPTASASFLPQLRSSRRGSFASLASTTQLDKETLSQALDQIHTTASQSITLTTFNEYTSPPSSSSGTESKGITSDLQGGLTGLYTRLRASVGNVKDIINVGGEGVVGETSSTKSFNGTIQSPALSTQSLSGSVQNGASSVSLPGIEAVPGLEEQSSVPPEPVDHQTIDRVPKTTPAKVSGGTSTPFKPASGFLVASKGAPLNLKQATRSTTISPAVAQINITATRDVGSVPQNGSKFGSVEPLISKSQAESVDTSIIGNGNAFQRNGHLSTIDSQKSQGLNKRSKHDLSEQSNHPHQNLETLDSSHIDTSFKSSNPTVSTSRVGQDAVQRDPLNEDHALRGVIDASSSGSDDEDLKTLSKEFTPRRGSTDDVFDASSTNDGHASASGPRGYQHLQLPLQKAAGNATPNTSHTPRLSLSRISSSEFDGNSLVNPPLQRASHHPSIKSPIQIDETDHASQANLTLSGASRDLRTMNVYSQVKNKVLNKQYWLKDENAKDCFYCGDTFSTFRRKHHCRTCGQIFDSKCTSLVPGNYFGQSGSIRVCKPCENIIYGDDDSSEFSDDGTHSIHGVRPRHGSNAAGDVLATPNSSPLRMSANTPRGNQKQPNFAAPTMSIPATRKPGRDSSRKPTVLEIDAEKSLARPPSSRSLKSSVGKSYHAGHRRQNSRQLLQRAFKTVNEDNAPFHQDPAENKGKARQLPAFHDDNFIDPDLAPFLSDEGSSEDEELSIMATLNNDGPSRSYENEKYGLNSLSASSKKLRSRIGEKTASGVTFTSRDTDTHSISSQKLGNLSRSSKRRNLSVTGTAHLRPSPRSYRNSIAAPYPNTNLHESTSSSALAQASLSGSPGKGPRMIRSSSMRGAAAPAVELNNASLRHVRKLLRQLLEDSRIPNITEWEKALVPILLRATDDVNPDVQNGDELDIRHYVKLKKIPGGRPGDSSYVSGLVFTKNLALKGMPRSISHPNILILTFALEYARPQLHFMSLDPVIRQEREFLQNVVNRIAALRPQLLLVERNVSGLALEFLHQANIATAYNVKHSVLEAISRCCQTRIISSIDKLAVKPAQAGRCESFYLKTYVDRGRKKTYMFLSGCAKELGCTIVLRGNSEASLSKMKRITEFMIYVVYNLKLETYLMRDEFASIPAITELGTLSSEKSVAPQPFQNILSGHSQGPTAYMGHSDQGTKDVETGAFGSSNLMKEKLEQASQTDKGKPSLPDEDSVPEDIPLPTFYGDMVEEHRTKILSASPFVKFAPPYLLMQAREQERRLAYMKRLRDQDTLEERNIDEKSKPQKFDLIRPEMIHERVETTNKKVREVLQAVHDAEYDKALYYYQTKSRQWETYISENVRIFDPYAHQNISVLFSVVCTVTTTPCEGPDVLAFDFYSQKGTHLGFEEDCTLGQYVEGLCVTANAVCTENGCQRRMYDHHRQYVHGEAQISVFIEPYACKLRGLQDSILMWSVCRKCAKETQVLPMSESSWKYSFAKYLELSFWSSELHARAGICPHDLHRDHIRYFGFKDVAIRVQYDAVILLEVVVPRPRITWKVDNDLRFKNDLFEKIEDRLNKFMLSVKARIKSINTESVLPEKVDSCKQEVERLYKQASEEHLALIRKLREKYLDSKHYEIIPLNRAIRATQEKVAEWDDVFAEFDQSFFPSEKDIRRLATLQLKKIFLDREDSSAPVNPSVNDPKPTVSHEALPDALPLDDSPALTPQTRRMSPEKAHDMLAAVVEKNGSADIGPDHHSAPATAVPSLEVEQTSAPTLSSEREDVRHLDLAMPAGTQERLDDNESAANRGHQQSTLSSHLVEQVADPSPTNASTKNHATTEGDSRTVNFESPSLKIQEGGRPSSIPRPIESSPRKAKGNTSPSLSRTQSQPVHPISDKAGRNSPQAPSATVQSSKFESSTARHSETTDLANASSRKSVDPMASDRLGIGALKPTSTAVPSMIPRSITNKGHDSMVSNLAKHFEQLSREFEKERIRERRQRAAKSHKARAYPTAASKPIIHIYQDIDEAVGEKETSDEDPLSSDQTLDPAGPTGITNRMTETAVSQTPGQGFHAAETTAENTDIEESNVFDSHAASDVEGEGNFSDEVASAEEDIIIPEANMHHALSPEEAQLDVKLDLPKHEKSTLMKMLTNFWAERSASGWQPLEYPLNATDHIFVDSDIIVREDEPSSLIAFVIDSQDYQERLGSTILSEATPDFADEERTSPSVETDGERVELEKTLLRTDSNHIKVQFTEGSAKMLCKIFFAEQFHALRRKCGVSERIVESLSRCMKWDSKGGKTKSVFLKTLDDRFVLKSLSPIETKAFIEFAPNYFLSMSRFLFNDMPSVIAKMVGLYQVIIKNPVTGTEFNYSLLVMENLFYDRSPDRTFDLKGSMRNRRIQSTGEQNEVLLDENMVDFIYETPLFSRDHSKRLLGKSVYNDTLFLAQQNVMDYSLMVGLESGKKELTVGIIDCIRTYTWDKKLESWIKDRGKNKPTVTSPREYKRRFRQAMGRYVLQVPSCWHQFEEKRAERLPVRMVMDEPGEEEKEGQVSVT